MSIWEMTQDAELQYWEAQNLKGIGRQLSFILRYFFRLPLNIFKNQTVLEVGTGPVGFVSLIEAQHKYGIEPLKDAFEKIFLLPKDVEWIANKGEEIPLKDNSVDTVLCFNVIPSHVDDVDKCLAEIMRVLTKKGTLVFGMKDDVKDRYHKHIYSRTQMKRKMQEYFNVVKEVDKYRMYGLFCKSNGEATIHISDLSQELSLLDNFDNNEDYYYGVSGGTVDSTLTKSEKGVLEI